MSLLNWLLIVEMLLLLSAGICYLAGRLVVRVHRDDLLYRCARTFWRELLKRPARRAPVVPRYSSEGLIVEPEEVDEQDIAGLFPDDEQAAQRAARQSAAPRPARQAAAAEGEAAGADPVTLQSTILVQVIPNAGSDQIVGRNGSAFHIQVANPNEVGLANKAILHLVAETLGVKLYQIQLVKGHYQSAKTLRISGLDQSEVENRLLGAAQPQ